MNKFSFIFHSAELKNLCYVLNRTIFCEHLSIIEIEICIV